jgi:peptide/nickel transport system substrate-binding protein
MSAVMKAGAFALVVGLSLAVGRAGAQAQSPPSVLRVDIGAELGSLDPLTVNDGQQVIYIHESVVEALTGVGSREGGVTPVLAESWETKGTNWVFHLRRGVRFHDGSQMTSADVVASYKRALAPGSQIGASRLPPKMEIVALDDYTVEWRMANIDPTVPARAAAIMIVPKDYADVSDQRLRDKLVGTGPYSLESWNKGISITLKAFPNYWSGKPASIPQVDMRFNAEAAVRFAGIQSGEINAAMGMPVELATKAFKVVSTPVPEMVVLRLNNLRGPFMDQRVREAANLAIDRQLLVDQLFSGYARPAKGQLVTEAVMGYSAQMKDFPYDPEKAKKLLKDAGATGVKITLNATRGRYANDVETSDAVAGMLKAVGFTVDLKTPPFAEWVKAHFAPKAETAPDISMGITGNEMFDLTRQYQWLKCGGGVSSTCIPEVDSLLDKAAAITDTAERQALYDKMWQIFQREAAYAFVLSPDLISFVDPRINWKPGGKAVVRFQDWSFAK